jgi:hypothetical protein
MGGGGGDNGYEARQQGIEDKKQQAREALNVLFGAAPSATDPSARVMAPDRAKFTTAAQGGRYIDSGEGTSDNSYAVWTPATETRFDEAGYNKAQTDYDNAQRMGSDATANAASRDGLYQQVRDTAFNAGKRELDETKQEAARKNKFELFARGLAGGSEDIDQNAKLNRTYQQGILNLGAKADSAKAQFRNNDEDTRLQLLQSIDNGMDTGSALSAASNRMKIAADQASADAQGTSLGNLFDTSGLIYQSGQAAKGRQAGQEWWNQYGNPSKRGSAAPTGVATRLPGE